MEGAPWVLGAATVMVGQLFAFLLGRLTERRAETREIKAEARKRSVTAAEELLDLIEVCDRKFADCYEHASGPDQDEIREEVRLIERKSLALDDPVAREVMWQVAHVYFHVYAIENMEGDRPSQIAFKTRSESHKALGAVIRPHEGKIERSSVLDSYVASIRDFYSQE